jgi:hypothetical protein
VMTRARAISRLELITARINAAEATVRPASPFSCPVPGQVVVRASATAFWHHHRNIGPAHRVPPLVSVMHLAAQTIHHRSRKSKRCY